MYVFAVKSRFWLTFRARASRDAINDGRVDVSCQLRVGVCYLEYKSILAGFLRKTNVRFCDIGDDFWGETFMNFQGCFFLARFMDLRSGTTTKTDNVISFTASVETENEFADPKIAVETENGDNSECVTVSTETFVDTENEKHSELDPEHSIEMDNEISQFVDSDNSVVTENGVQNEITLSSLAGMLSRQGDIMCENKRELHTSMTRLEEKIDRNQNDIYQFNYATKIIEDKLMMSSQDPVVFGTMRPAVYTDLV